MDTFLAFLALALFIIGGFRMFRPGSRYLTSRWHGALVFAAGFIVVALGAEPPEPADQSAQDASTKQQQAAAETAETGTVLVSIVERVDNRNTRRLAERLRNGFPKALADAIHELEITQERPPHKVVAEITLMRRVAEENVKQIRKIFYSSLPRDYEKIFVPFRIKGQPECAGYWSPDHGDRDADVTIFGLSQDQHRRLSDATFEVKDGERLIAEAQFDYCLPGRYQIIERTSDGGATKYVVRIHMIGDDGSFGHFDDEVEFRDGAYWGQGSPSGDRYVISDGRIEVRDNSGLIMAADPL